MWIRKGFSNVCKSRGHNCCNAGINESNCKCSDDSSRTIPRIIQNYCVDSNQTQVIHNRLESHDCLAHLSISCSKHVRELNRSSWCVWSYILRYCHFNWVSAHCVTCNNRWCNIKSRIGKSQSYGLICWRNCWSFQYACIAYCYHRYFNYWCWSSPAICDCKSINSLKSQVINTREDLYIKCSHCTNSLIVSIWKCEQSWRGVRTCVFAGMDCNRNSAVIIPRSEW